ncbi:cyclin-like protein [Sistotremastrum suecicum HHB10207 ss-3]|uniref:Cyclin-like protein n=1 Tax=Sistotremastrum suecicum HHB10207 ss-3 TaxID=1314776 RepID=A0A166F0R5_9AGAM|nr:cyclin-like protein [Sistotremastrum suecicum HHB10207 ss-3]
MTTDASSQDQPWAARTKQFQPYFTEQEVKFLSEKQRGKMSQSQEERARQQACGFIEAVGVKLGFPRRTVATAQNLYHRFHLYFHRKTWSYHDVTLAALYVSSKIHDTLKKPRDILMVGYAVRFPELAAKSKATGGEIEIDPGTVASDTERLLGVERLFLEVICFNFKTRMPFPYVIKIGKELRATKRLTQLAWRLSIDSHRTLISLQYPPHCIALACLYLAALLSSFETPEIPEKGNYRSSHQMAQYLGSEGPWQSKFKCRLEDIDEISHAIIDLLNDAASSMSLNTSPSTPSSPSPHPSPRHSSQYQPPPAPYKPDQLIRLKIYMRSKNIVRRHRERPPLSEKDPSESYGAGKTAWDIQDGSGKNTGTTRFLFGPSGSETTNGVNH